MRDVTHAVPAEAVWQIPGAAIVPSPAGVAAFCGTPIHRLLERGAEETPDREALVGLEGSLTHADLLHMARSAAAAIAARTEPGAGVACLLRRSPECMAALLGCAISGRVCLVLDPAERPARLLLLLADAKPALVLRGAGPAADPALPDLTVADALAAPGEGWTPPPADPDAPLAVHFTSGSTGLPKGIVLSARSVLRRAVDEMAMREAGPRDALFHPMMPMNSAGFSILLGMLWRRGRLLVADMMRESPTRIAAFLARNGVTQLSASSPLARTIAGFPNAQSALRQVRCLAAGATAMSRADLAALRDALPPSCEIVHTFGSTEALTLAHWVVREGRLGPEPVLPAGVAGDAHEMILLDEHGAPAGPGEPGELAVRSRVLALGEWRAGRVVPGRTVAVPGRPGWRMFRTGDLVGVQPDGMLRVLGRIDRQIKVNGLRIEPAEIEAVLCAAPDVSEAAVVAVPVAGKLVLHGFVVASGRPEAAVLADLRALLRSRLPPASRPRHLTVLDRLPRLGAGKLDALALMRRAEAAPAA